MGRIVDTITHSSPPNGPLIVIAPQYSEQTSRLTLLQSSNCVQCTLTARHTESHSMFYELAPLLVCAALVAAVLRAIYNVYFHSLSRFPGPKLAAASFWWQTYIDILEQKPWATKLVELHNTYGACKLTLAHCIFPDTPTRRYCSDGSKRGALTGTLPKSGSGLMGRHCVPATFCPAVGLLRYLRPEEPLVERRTLLQAVRLQG